MEIAIILDWAAVIVGLAAAGLSLRAATIHVRDNIDAFIGDIHRQSWWSTLAAAAASATALLVALKAFAG